MLYFPLIYDLMRNADILKDSMLGIYQVHQADERLNECCGGFFIFNQETSGCQSADYLCQK